MAAIAPLNPYESLGRKIGYSVGLENLIRNTLELASLYVRQRSVSYADWATLVRDSFGRKERAAHEIANFFGTLNLIHIMGRELHVLHGLDALSILRRYFEGDDPAFLKGARFLLTQAILEADGDVFLSTLTGGFEPEDSRAALERMVRWKWDRLSRVFKNPELQKKIWDVIAIKSQPSGTKKPNAFAARKGPSPFEPHRRPFGETPSKDFRVADSYLEKVLPTRKGWARDLLLFEDAGRTEIGNRMLKLLPSIGIGSSDGTYFFWPYERDLAKLRIDPTILDAPALDDWQLLLLLARAVGGIESPKENEQTDDEALIKELREFHALYKAGSEDRGRIRHQLPLFMAKPLVVAVAVAKGKEVPPLPQVVQREARSQHRRLTVTNMRGTDGALVFSP